VTRSNWLPPDMRFWPAYFAEYQET